MFFYDNVYLASFGRKFIKIAVWSDSVDRFDASYTKAWFSYVGKIPDDRGFYCFPTVPDFAD